ncbi:putative cytochrome P450 [Rosellinia necatrix]|uniref:Putative cytochrome P450 n=1 Tax=Rosellinia necatrix TaxID=77044 RepID=A0A1W2TSD3_ROSNE|nr:putative cytochrome P450 [Rosellinia necatrix]
MTFQIFGIISRLGPTAWVGASLLAWFFYAVCLVVYRLYFHPLAGFPGPKLAAATGWYEFYFQCWLEGQYIFEIERMVEKYGPIIRVTPEELFIHDPQFYNELYVNEKTRRSNHYDSFAQGIGFDGCHLLTVDHDLHRTRRKPLEPFFSKRGVLKLQPMLAEIAELLETRLRQYANTGEIVRLDYAFTAYTGDIIGRMCLDTNDPRDLFLNKEDFSADWAWIMQMIIRSVPLFSGFPWIIWLIKPIPSRVLLWLYPRGQAFAKFQDKARSNIRRALSSNGVGAHDERVESLFHHVASSEMPVAEKSEERLAKEAQLLLGGGTVTSARVISCATYYILTQPDVLERLREELRQPMKRWPVDVPSWTDLERLPFLQAVIKEALRVDFGVMTRLPRISPDLSIQYGHYHIPAGVPVGMSSYFMHTDAEVFPEPLSFKPERWLGDVNPLMNRNFVPFTRGSRTCLGSNLAMAEISLVLAVLFRPHSLRFELFETDESDVRVKHDFGVPLPKLDSKGVRAFVHESAN